jgi:hypothetical protein
MIGTKARDTVRRLSAASGSCCGVLVAMTKQTDPVNNHRESVTVDFAPITNSRIRELAACFDIVLGFTPESK